MSTENILKFSQTTASDPRLAAKIQTLQALPVQNAAEELARLSVEAGSPFTAEEFLAQADALGSELSEEQLESVAGGFIRTGPSSLSQIFGLPCKKSGPEPV